MEPPQSPHGTADRAVAAEDSADDQSQGQSRPSAYSPYDAIRRAEAVRRTKEGAEDRDESLGFEIYLLGPYHARISSCLHSHVHCDIVGLVALNSLGESEPSFLDPATLTVLEASAGKCLEIWPGFRAQIGLTSHSPVTFIIEDILD